LLIEELCCDLSRFDPEKEDGLSPEEIQIDRELPLGHPDAFADIRVRSRGETYFIEVKYGSRNEEILRSLAQKYAQSRDVVRKASQITNNGGVLYQFVGGHRNLRPAGSRTGVDRGGL
jgi:hypothetical protein